MSVPAGSKESAPFPAIPRGANPPAADACPGDILVIKPSSLGDVVHALPAVALVKKHWPQARLRWLINPEWAPLLEDNPYVHEAILFPRGEFRGLAGVARIPAWAKTMRREQRADLALDFQGLLRSALIARLCCRGEIVGLSDAREGARFLYHRVADVRGIVHAVDRYLGLVKCLGIDIAQPLEWPLPPGEAPDGFSAAAPFVLLHPFSRGAGKSLSVADTLDFCRAVAPRPVVLVGRTSETVPRLDHVTDLLNRTTLSALIWLVRRAAFVVERSGESRALSPGSVDLEGRRAFPGERPGQPEGAAPGGDNCRRGPFSWDDALMGADSRHEQHGQSLWAMRAQDQDALDITGPAGAGDEGDKAGIASLVFRREVLVGGGKIRENLTAARDDDVVRRKYAQDAASGTWSRDAYGSRLSDQRFAFGKARIGGFHGVFFIPVVDPEQSQRFGQLRRDQVDQGAGMQRDPLPLASLREGSDVAGGVFRRRAFAKFGAKHFAQPRKEGDLLLPVFADLRKPFPKRDGRGRVPFVRMRFVMTGRGRAKGFRNARQDGFAIAAHFRVAFLLDHQS
jgi:heptosyltransferase-1